MKKTTNITEDHARELFHRIPGTIASAQIVMCEELVHFIGNIDKNKEACFFALFSLASDNGKAYIIKRMEKCIKFDKAHKAALEAYNRKYKETCGENPG